MTKAEAGKGLDRLKTSRGKFPVTNAYVQPGKGRLAEIAFDFPDEPSEADAEDGILLEHLACALPAYADVPQEEVLARLTECAAQSGPLLGEPTAESLFDWQVAVRFAQCALNIQQALNAHDYGEVEHYVVKSVVSEQGPEKPLFTLYCLSLPVGAEGDTKLLSTFPTLPWMKRFAEEAEGSGYSGRRDYAFACYDEQDEQQGIDLYLISFSQEIPSGEYAYMASYFASLGLAVPPDTESERAGADVPQMARGRTFDDIPIDDSDAACLQRLVHALISLHTEGVYVDLFKSDGSKDFLAFRTYLSSLWYDFATRLGVVKVGYCEECGRGFPLTGHRGIDRAYCSDECRTKAKNNRRRKQLAHTREMFKNGASVEEIASEVYPKMLASIARENVRKHLRTWPWLKQAVAQDLQAGDGALTRRCVEEGAIEEDFVLAKAKTAKRLRKS